MMLAAGADPGLALEDGTTALMLAAEPRELLTGRVRNAARRRRRKLWRPSTHASLGPDVNAAWSGWPNRAPPGRERPADTIIQFLAEKGANLTRRTGGG